MVDEANDSFTTLLHLESWSGNHTIISNMACFDARVDLNVDRLDIDLVVVNVLKRSDYRQQICRVKRVYTDRSAYLTGVLTGGIGRGYSKKFL